MIRGGFGAKTSAWGRARFAAFASMSADVEVTGSQREQYNLAKTTYDDQAPILDALYEERVPDLEQAFEDAGGILIKGRR